MKTNLIQGINMNKPYYGYPVFDILISTFQLIILSLVLVTFIVLNFPRYITFFLAMAELFYFLKLIFHGRKYHLFQMIIVNKMIDLSKLNGKEIILDLGTGDGILAVNFAKHLNKGRVYGIDRWKWPSKLLITSPFLMSSLKIGCSLYNAKKNSMLEKVSDKCKFINGNFIRGLDFPDSQFDLVISRHSLYFIKKIDHQKKILFEVIRVLKEDGKIIFCEPHRTITNISWNLNNIKRYFENLGYEVNILPNNNLKSWKANTSILIVKKNCY